MIGFCPEGPECEYEHPRFELPVADGGGVPNIIQCHYCHKFGHKSNFCPENPNAIPEDQRGNFEHKFTSHRVRDPGARDAQMRYQQKNMVKNETGVGGGSIQREIEQGGQPSGDPRDEEQILLETGQRPAKMMRFEGVPHVKTGYVPSKPKHLPPANLPPQVPQETAPPASEAPEENPEPAEASENSQGPPPVERQPSKFTPKPLNFNRQPQPKYHNGINRPGFGGVMEKVNRQAMRGKHPDYRPGVPRNMDNVQCYKCMETGHYANKCPNQKVIPTIGQPQNAQNSVNQGVMKR